MRHWHDRSWDSPKHLWEKLPGWSQKRCMKCRILKVAHSHSSPGSCPERDHYDSLRARIRRGDTKVVIDEDVPAGNFYFFRTRKD